MSSSPLVRHLDKWWQTMKISWSKITAYKLNFVFVILGPSLVFFFIKYNLWSAIYSVSPDMVIQGYDFDSMVRYQIWVLVVALVGQGHNSMNLAEDIRLGRISSYLIYPFNFWQFHSAHFLAFQVIQLVASGVVVTAVASSGLLSQLSWQALWSGYLFSLYVGFFWFALQYLIGVMAFWLEETWVLRVLLVNVSLFLSGALLPLEIFPPWLVRILQYSPFPYITYVPTKLFMGEYDGSIGLALGVLTMWLGLVLLFTQWVWRRGLKLYTAAGM